MVRKFVVTGIVVATTAVPAFAADVMFGYAFKQGDSQRYRLQLNTEMEMSGIAVKQMADMTVKVTCGSADKGAYSMNVVFEKVEGGLNIWTAAMVTAAFAFSWFTLRGSYFLKAFLLILAAAVSSVFWSARPHLVSLVLTAATLFVLEKSTANDDGSHRKILFWLPAIMLLWVNSHGGFVVGFMLWGIYWLAEQSAWIISGMARNKYARIFKHPATFFTEPDYRLTLAGLLMRAAGCINPAGFQMFNYPFQTVGIAALREYIQEWHSPDFHSLSVQPFWWLLFTGFAAVGLSRRVISLAAFMWFTIFASMGFMAGRNIALFALTAPLVISRHLDPVLSAFSPRIFGATGLTKVTN